MEKKHSAKDGASNGNLKDIVYISLPQTMRQEINGFTVDPSKKIPLQLNPGQAEVDVSKDVRLEMIMAGMLKVIAWDTENPDTDYYKQFVLALQPDAVKELNLAAIAKAKVKDYDFAQELFLVVNHLDPQPSTFINLAVIYGELAAKFEADGNETEADMYQEKLQHILQEGLRLYPQDIDLLSEYGTFNLYQGNMEIAREYLDKYLELAPDSPKKKQVANMMGDVHEKLDDNKTIMQAYDEIQMGNDEQAIKLLDEFLKDNPKVWNAWFLKGWALRRLANYQDALPCFMKCLELGEVSSDIYNEVAICTLEVGNRELAKDYLDIALDLDPENIKILTNLAYLHLKDGQLDKARHLLERARVIDERDPGVQHLMQDYQQQTGEQLASVIVEELVDANDLLHPEEHEHEHDHAHDEE